MDKINSKNIKSIICGLLILLTKSSYALTSDQQEVIQVQADSVDLCQKSHSGYLKGNVQMDQGTTHLRADCAHTTGNEKNQLIMAVARGTNKKQAHYWTLTTNTKPPLHAYADEIFYYPQKHLIKLVGNAHICQDKNSFKAPIILFDTIKQQIISQKTDNQRTTIVIHQDKLLDINKL